MSNVARSKELGLTRRDDIYTIPLYLPMVFDQIDGNGTSQQYLANHASSSKE
jgi:hypothetical protein